MASPAAAPDISALVDTLLEAALSFVPVSQCPILAAKWSARWDPLTMTADRVEYGIARAALLAGDLLVSQPSASGATAFDRLARASKPAGAAEAAALAALRASRFRLLRLLEHIDPADALLRDEISGATLRLIDADLPIAPGVFVFVRIAMLDDGRATQAGIVTPLDEAALAVARAHPAAAAASATANSRWAEALYAHVVRHGTLEISGLDHPGDADDVDEFEDPLHATALDLARDWSDLRGAEPGAALLRRTRAAADPACTAYTLAAAAMMHDAADIEAPGAEAIADIERLLLLMLQTIHLRAEAGSGNVSLDMVRAVIDTEIAQGGFPPNTRKLFERLRRRLATPAGQPGDPGLDGLLQRIQALRAKTVDRGCTEHEALAAAEKVAELLDRHGLSLSELEFRAQPCAGIGIQTDRRRTGPIDMCIPAIAALFDCRVWAERGKRQPIRYIFFGLRPDVAAAQYVYELAERAFATETAAFRKSALYRDMQGDRRSATDSFQTGLAHGINAKLAALRTARAARSAFGRDLVPVKIAMIDDEMERLGLSLTSRTLGGSKRLLADAYADGQAAGGRFEFAPPLEHQAA